MSTPTQPPLIVAIPSIGENKMRAILSLSEAVSSLATALNSVSTNVMVSHCVFTNTETGIKIATSDDPPQAAPKNQVPQE